MEDKELDIDVVGPSQDPCASSYEERQIRLQAYELAAKYTSTSAVPEHVIEKAEKIYKWLLTGEHLSLK